MKAFLHIFLCLCIALAGAIAIFFVRQPTAYAQNCVPAKVMIFEMLEPERASYNLWDTVYGEPDMYERFVSAVPLDERVLMVAGERRAYKDGKPSLLLVKIDHRGRAVWEKEHKISGLFEIKRIIKQSDRYLVLGTREESEGRFRYHRLWLGFFDSDGNLIKEQDFDIEKTDIDAQDIIKIPGEDAYLMALSARKRQENPYSIVYKIDMQGRKISERAFVPGPENRIHSLAALRNGSLMGVGYVYGEDGRKHGWILSLDTQGRMDWERQYPRGQESRFFKVVEYQDDTVMVIGRSKPVAKLGRYDGGMVMRINPYGGDVIWERYYTGPRHYEAVDILPSPDGLMTVALNGINDHQKKKGRSKEELSEEEENGLAEAERWGLDAVSTENDFVRLLTIDPRGVLLSSSEYFNSHGAHVSQVIANEQKSRVLVGDTDMKDVIPTGDPDFPTEEKRSQEGWIVSAPGLEPYDDPCRNIEVYNP